MFFYWVVIRAETFDLFRVCFAVRMESLFRVCFKNLWSWPPGGPQVPVSV